ncbi:hypothetical protein OKW21_005228 [Catalinimonas alkaloidigena]|uniref:ABC transporter permease n=1 Tax=Catalinimonas alkaloidigena TaxID=1075417 RepID=UPI0024062EF2|nr:hypothetical protein [Catalinimonas alkaloidigena]MDF9799965.1 hypothetical protein [Catalinimonas alkaloidigena]
MNEYTVYALGHSSPTEAMGEPLTVGNQEVRISGIVKNFHYLPVMERIEIFALYCRPLEFAYMLIKLSSTHIQAILAGLTILMKVVGYFAFLSICIACLGFLGIAIYTAEIKMKEVCICKVLGAELYQLIFYF